MEFSLQLLTKDFEAALTKTAAALDRDLDEVYREQIDLLMRQIMKLTPPKNRTQGLRRVENDLRFACVEAHEKFLQQLERRHGRGPASFPWRFKGGQEGTIAYARIIYAIDELRAWHRSRMHEVSGRVRKIDGGRSLNNPQKAFVGKTVFARYLRELKQDVGAAKGGWAAAQQAVATGRPLASWMASPQKRLNGTVLYNLTGGGPKSFTAVNRSPWAKRGQEPDRIVHDAMRQRLRAIPLALERQLKLRYTAAGFLVRGTDIVTGTVRS